MLELAEAQPDPEVRAVMVQHVKEALAGDQHNVYLDDVQVRTEDS
jgi:hypothetical protein